MIVVIINVWVLKWSRFRVEADGIEVLLVALRAAACKYQTSPDS